MTPCQASRRNKRPITLAAHISALAISVLFAIHSQAAVRVTSVTGASNTENIGSSADETKTPVIFGGVTGAPGSHLPSGVACSGNGLCNTCVNTPINTDPVACNERAITPLTQIIIQFTATKAGFPILTNKAKTAAVAEGTSSVSIGQTAEIITTWGAICTQIDTVDSACLPSGSGRVGAETLYVGVSKDQDDTLDDTEDESTQITFTVSDSMGDASMELAPACNTSSPNAICAYSIQSGDEKAVLTDLGKIGSFPTMTGINIHAMRVFFQQCNWSNGIVASEFNSISPLSNPVDLRIEVDADGIPQLVENEITGLTNGLTYCTKIGHVDQAMNVGLYTPASEDVPTCSTIFLKDTGGVAFAGSCHVARPDEVLGVMSESCFIATAAYGSPWAIKVQTFRDFRNKFMLSNNTGRKFVKWYYETSPRFAKKIARSSTARAITRGALSPVWIFAWVSLKIGLLGATLLTFSLFAAPFVWMACLRKRLNSVSRQRLEKA